MFNVDDAMREGAPVIHDYTEHNVAKREVVETGDLDAGFAEAMRLLS